MTTTTTTTTMCPQCGYLPPHLGGSGISQNSSTRSPKSSTLKEPASPSQSPTELTIPIKVSLEDLHNGVLKHYKSSRRLLNGSLEEKILDIRIYPGWKSGTKIRFPRAGNEQRNGKAQDLVFVIEEKPHEKFERDGNNLLCNVSIMLVLALTHEGGRKEVDLLDGRKVQIPIPIGIVKPGQETTITGEGMPIRVDGAVMGKGDLIIRWNVVYPDLTLSQKNELRRVLTSRDTWVRK